MHAYIVCTYRSRKGDVHAQVDAPSKCDIGQASSSRYMDVNVLLVLFNNCIYTYMYILYREPALDWADTLVLPTRFSARTTTAIETGVLTRSSRIEIVDSLATLMLLHTSRPTPHDLDIISHRLIEKFPTLRDALDKGYVSIEHNKLCTGMSFTTHFSGFLEAQATYKIQESASPQSCSESRHCGPTST